jgi:endonuclease YncB( thermonuclease family)
MTRFILIALLIATPAVAGDITGIPRIMDGDTVEIENTKIRLSGIDAPERGRDGAFTLQASESCDRR